MGIWDSLNKDNFTNGLKMVTETADKVIKQGTAGGKFISEKTMQGAAAIKENVQDDLARRQETKIIKTACEEILSKNQLQLTVSQKMLEEEITVFNEAIEQITKKQLYVYIRYCQYLQKYRQQRNIAKSSLADVVYPNAMNLWQSKKYATGAMAAGAATGIATIGLVTALGSASTGTALTALSGPAYVHALLATLGGGSIATGGLGMAGGVAVLGTIVAAPMLAVASLAVDKKIRSDYDEVKRWQLEVIRYSQEVQDTCKKNDHYRQSLRLLGQDMQNFASFFQEMLNIALGTAACDIANGYMPLLNDAATTLIAYSQLLAGKKLQENNWADFAIKREELNEVASRCRREFYQYYASLSTVKQSFLEKVRWQDSVMKADHLQEAIYELRQLFLEGWQDIRQDVQVMHTEMNRRFDAIDSKLFNINDILMNMTGDIRRLQHETEQYLNIEPKNSKNCEKILQKFTDQLTIRLLDSSLLRSHDLCAREQENLEERFGDNWQQLKLESQRFLITARVLFVQMEAVSDKLDYSGVCILLLKALETELHQRLFCDYRDFMEKQYPFKQQPELWPSVLCYEDSCGIRHQLAEEHFTLGSVPYFCNTRIPSNISDKTNEYDRACLFIYAKQRLFQKNLNEKQIWHELTQLGRDAEIVTKRYRNRAAHVDVLHHKEARQCMDFLLDVQQVMVWLMKKFIA